MSNLLKAILGISMAVGSVVNDPDPNYLRDLKNQQQYEDRDRMERIEREISVANRQQSEQTEYVIK